MNINNKCFTAIVLGVLFLGVLALPGLAGAYTPANPGQTLDVTGIDDVTGVVDQIVGIMQTVLFAIAGIFVVIAGYQYLTAGGDPEKTANARNMLIYAIIAIGIGLLATFISTLVLNLLNAS